MGRSSRVIDPIGLALLKALAPTSERLIYWTARFRCSDPNVELLMQEYGLKPGELDSFYKALAAERERAEHEAKTRAEARQAEAKARQVEMQTRMLAALDRIAHPPPLGAEGLRSLSQKPTRSPELGRPLDPEPSPSPQSPLPFVPVEVAIYVGMTPFEQAIVRALKSGLDPGRHRTPWSVFARRVRTEFGNSQLTFARSTLSRAVKRVRGKMPLSLK